MCAITLCSVCPTSSGSTRNAASTHAARSTTSPASATGLTPLGSRFGNRAARPPRRGGRDAGRQQLAPGRRRGVGVRLPRFLGPRPGLGGTRGELEALAQRRALETVRQQQGSQAVPAAVVVAGEV